MRRRKPDPTITFVPIDERADLGLLVGILVRHCCEPGSAAPPACEQPVNPGTPESATIKSSIARCARTAVNPNERRSP